VFGSPVSVVGSACVRCCLFFGLFFDLFFCLSWPVAGRRRYLSLR